MKILHWVALALVLAAFPPPAIAQPDDNLALVQGFVWVDENLNGIRDPDEPLLGEHNIGIGFVDLRSYLIVVTTDSTGKFSVRLPAGGGYAFRLTWGEVLQYTGGGSPLDWSYFGCADFRAPPDASQQVLDLRVRRTYYPIDGRGRQLSRSVPVAQPESWPVANGQFFITTAPDSGILVSCDSGFAVTNDEGMPFWDVLLARGIDQLGKPVTGRFERDGRVRQAFEQAVLEWDGDTPQMLVLSWEESGMTRGTLREEPFIPGPTPHFLGLPSLDAEPPANAAEATPFPVLPNLTDTVLSEENGALVQGYLWVDENSDGIRQPEEPLLGGQGMIIGAGGRYYRAVRTDAEGKYTVRLPSGCCWVFSVQWGQVTARPAPFLEEWSHNGGTSFALPASDIPYVVDVRIWERGIPQPTQWPVANGYYFATTLDRGFAVTNEGGIPFWDATLAQGLNRLGRPVSERFAWNNRTRQAFERGVLEWDASAQSLTTLTWEAAEMTRGSDDVAPFRPGPSPHYLGLPSLDVLEP